MLSSLAVVVSQMRSCALKVLGLMLKDLITSAGQRVNNGFFLQHATACRSFLTGLLNFAGR